MFHSGDQNEAMCEKFLMELEELPVSIPREAARARCMPLCSHSSAGNRNNTQRLAPIAALLFWI